MQGATATSAKLEESTAALGRAPIHVDGLTEFLRKEYYRRMGIYLNGGRKEEGILFNFWKEHVSEAYKNLAEQKKQEQKMMSTLKQQERLQKLATTDPVAYRKMLADKEAKAKA